MKTTTNTPKTFTIKQIVKGLAPYMVIVIMITVFAGTVFGWTIRSDFDETVRSAVTTQVEQLKANTPQK